MTIYTTYCKYLCLAALAGVFVAGVPSQGNALDFGIGFESSAIEADVIGQSTTTPTKICGDYVNKSCSPNGTTQQCRTKGNNGRPVYYCTQTCNDGKWSSAHDCSTTPPKSGQVEVLEVF